MEVFTLDSATCAACTYMMGAANEAKEAFGDQIDMIEYKFTKKENIARCKKMGVKNLPSIYINGKLKFSSIVPAKEELGTTLDEMYVKFWRRRINFQAWNTWEVFVFWMPSGFIRCMKPQQL